MAGTYGGVLAIQQMAIPIEARAPKRDLRGLPSRLGPWVAEEGLQTADILVDDDADIKSVRTYRNAAGDAVSLYADLWQEHRGRTPHRPEACYTGSGYRMLKQKTVQLQVADQPGIPVRVLSLERDGQRITVLYWYQRGNEVLLSSYWRRRATWVLIAARNGATFAAGGGQLSGCAMGREIGRAAIEMDRNGEWTDAPWSRSRRARMNSPRYEVASSLKPCSASVTTWSVHRWLDGRGSAQELRETSHHPSFGTRRSANLLRHFRRDRRRIPMQGAMAPATLGEPAPRASEVVAAGNSGRSVARGQLAAFSTHLRSMKAALLSDRITRIDTVKVPSARILELAPLAAIVRRTPWPPGSVKLVPS